jgi:hypothetical protein
MYFLVLFLVVDAICPKLDGRFSKEKLKFYEALTSAVKGVQNLCAMECDKLASILNDQLPAHSLKQGLIEDIKRSFQATKV